MANICFIGKHILSKDFLKNELDTPFFLYFARRFDRVFLIYQSNGDHIVHSSHQNIDIILLPQKRKLYDLLFFVVSGIRIMQSLRTEHEINIVNASEPFGAGLIALLATRFSKIPFVLQIQGEVFDYPRMTHSWLKSKLARWMTIAVSSCADRIRCVSEKIHTQAIKAGIDAEKLFCSPSRCDTDMFEPEAHATERKALREKFGFCDQTILVFISSLHPDKGFEEFVEAYLLLRRKYPDVRALAVGDGPSRKAMELLISRKELNKDFIFCGKVGHSHIPAYLAAGDIYVLPTKHEAMPRSVLEAMAMGLPVVASAVGGIPEVIEDGQTGLLISSQNSDEIADKIMRYLKDPSFAGQAGRKARERVVEKYDFQKNIEQFIQVHLNMISSRA